MATRTQTVELTEGMTLGLVASSRPCPETVFGTYAERAGHLGNLDPQAIQKPASLRW